MKSHLSFFKRFLFAVLIPAVVAAAEPLELAPITITASPEPKSTWNTPASVSVIEGRQLDKQRGQSVMSAIQNQAGVNMIDEGPTVVKPIIRGLNSQDIVVVEDGIRSESLQWGNEHAPEINALGADRIEVMRGPNSLLYGSDALGGVISVNHPELPNAHTGAGPLAGRITTDVNSVNNSVGENIELSGASGDWGYRTNISQLQAGNYRTPAQGFVPNTGDQEASGTGTVGVRKDWGALSVDYGHFSKHVELQNVDPPGFPSVPLADLEYQVLKHDHAAVRSTVNTAPARLDMTVGYDWVNREEFDSPNAPDNPTALHWTQANYNADVKAHLVAMGPFQGTLGASGIRRLEQSLGDTHLTPGYNQTGYAGYLVEDLSVGKFNFTFGARGDQNQYNVSADNLIGGGILDVNGNPHPVVAQTLKYSAFSGAVGGVYHVAEPLAFAVNVGRGYRNPIPFELFAFGEHEGSNQFLIGNSGLTPETSINTDASIRWSSARIKAEFGVFRNYIHNFIYSSYTGQFLDATSGQIVADAASCPPGDDCGLPVVSQAQSNATITGVDGAVSVAATDWLSFKTVYNLVRGYNDSGDVTLPSDYLPHVPADNLLVGGDIHGKTLGFLSHPYFGADWRLTAAHQRVGPEEVPTPGYGLVDLHTGGEVVVMNNRLTLDAGVNNLLDKGYIDFNSIVKQANIQNPGRNVYVKVSVPFGS